MTTRTEETLERRRELVEDRVAQYRRMVEIREFEDRIVGLFAEGLVQGTTHTCQGQEALDIALALALRPTDTVCCTYRGHGIALALGMTPATVLGEIMGRQSGCMSGLGGSMHLSAGEVGLMPTAAIVGANIPIAAGAALAHQVKQDDGVAVAVFGDGASNIGAFHEALNLAAVWRLPVVFVCDNNLYGEYSRVDRTTSVSDISRRSAAYDMPGRSVDAMDLDVVHGALAEAVERARSGGGPTLLEARTYRFAGHSRADQALYRPAGELDSWRPRDPVTLMRTSLLDGGASADDLVAVETAVSEEIDAVVAATREIPEPTREHLVAHVWAAPPPGWPSRGSEG